MFNISAVFSNFKSGNIQNGKIKDNTPAISENQDLLFNGNKINISSLSLNSDDAKNLEIAIALCDIGKMSGLED